MSATSNLDLEVRQIVFNNLSSADQNGSFKTDGYLFGYSAEDIADDLIMCASDCEAYTAAMIIPYVKEWLAL
jgi:hypothetical protein